MRRCACTNRGVVHAQTEAGMASTNFTASTDQHRTQHWRVLCIAVTLCCCVVLQGGSVAHIMRYKFPDGLEEPVIATIMKEVRQEAQLQAYCTYCLPARSFTFQGPTSGSLASTVCRPQQACGAAPPAGCHSDRQLLFATVLSLLLWVLPSGHIIVRVTEVNSSLNESCCLDESVLACR